MEVLDKVTIESWILPHLSVGERGKDIKVEMTALIEAILYKLKTGCQWRQLPVKQFFDEAKLTWQGVYYHFNEWRRDGSWKRVWLNVLRRNKRFLDLSSIQLDGSHTRAQNGGQALAYQGRKAAKTTTSLFLADNTGVMLACATPQAGNHHDLFEIEQLFEELCSLLESARINLKDCFSMQIVALMRKICGRFVRSGIFKPTSLLTPVRPLRQVLNGPILTKNSTNGVRLLNTPTRGWTASKPCLFATRRRWTIGSRFTGWPLWCYF